ncbi:MAG TPA: rod shape-determining protein RodA [Synergistales bacterium]|nr:rod shape-determining protein RodA [Synergistales bacterium]
MTSLGQLREELSRLKDIDRVLVAAVVPLMIIGVLSIYSALAGKGGVAVDMALKQSAWCALGAAAFAAAFVFGHERVFQYGYWIYGGAFLSLVAVLVAGYTAKGATSWFDFGAFRFQPSEPAKLALSVSLALFLCRYPPKTLTNVAGAMLLSSLVILPVLLQPDLGGVVVYAFMIFVALALAGMPRKYILLLAGVALLSFPLGWSMLKEYQKLRMLVFLNPSIDPLGAGYNVIQSRIAVGAGGFFGKGFLQGTQSRLHFLPEAHTDFVFSVFSEEFGFAGASLVLALFAILLWRMLRTAARSSDPRARILVETVSAWIWFQLFENIAMAVGIAPVTGLALPFVSYGGSSMLSLGAALGLVQSVHVSSRPQYE